MFDSERKHISKSLMQLAVRIGTLVQKAHSAKIYDYKKNENDRNSKDDFNTTITKNEIASHPSSNRISNIDFRNFVHKIEQAEVTMKLEKTDNSS